VAYIRLDQYHGAALAVAAVIESGPGGVACYQIDYTFDDPNDTFFNALLPPFTAPTTLNPADKNSVTLSNNNLTVTQTVAGFNAGGVRSTNSYTGRRHFEFAVGANIQSSELFMGIATAAWVLNSGNMGDANSMAVTWSTGSGLVFAKVSGLIGSFPGSVLPGDIIALEIDFGAKLVWVRNGTRGPFNWNGSATANPAAGVGGWSFAGVTTAPYFIGIAVDGASRPSVTVNFGDTPFAVTPSVGFSSFSAAWDNSLIPAVAQAALVSTTFDIPTSPIWARVQLLAGATSVRVVFTQYEAHRTTQVAKMPPTQMLALPQEMPDGRPKSY
jgi:hypothetical protein